MAPGESGQLSGTGRHLSALELRAWTSFLDAGRLLEIALARQLESQSTMTHRDYEILVRLDGAGGRMRMSVLANQVAASGPLLTQTITRLQDRGWVERQQVSEDRRGIDAVLLVAGREALAGVSESHADVVRELLLEQVGDEDLPAFAEAVGRVADHLRSHRTGAGCGRADCVLDRL